MCERDIVDPFTFNEKGLGGSISCQTSSNVFARVSKAVVLVPRKQKNPEHFSKRLQKVNNKISILTKETLEQGVKYVQR